MVLSKYDPVEKIEYLVAFNNSKRASTATVTTSSTAQWKSIFGSAKLTAKGASVNVNRSNVQMKAVDTKFLSPQQMQLNFTQKYVSKDLISVNSAMVSIAMI